MSDCNSFLEALNPQQRAAAESGDGPVLVLAGPGSGKTRVLTHRIAFLVQARRIAPWRIMAVTFTNKAAREMGARLEQLLGAEACKDLTIGTFHAFCARLLRRESGVLPFESRFVIFDDADQRKVVRLAIAEEDLDDKRYQPRATLNAISRAKNELHRPAEFPTPTLWHEGAARVYERYQAILRASEALDFDDLLMEAVYLLRDHDDIRARYRKRYEHILVDEFQDTNTAQYELLKLLGGAGEGARSRNLFLVGDEDQSIYRWRGADTRNVRRLRRDFPDLEVLLLEQNYRSTQTILDAARAVIDRNPHRTHKALWTDSGRGSPITLFEAYNEAEEAAYVVHEIQRLLDADEPYGRTAVMYRTNAQSRALEDAFVRSHIPYQLVGATRFYERREIRDVLAYLRLIHNPLNDIALERIINVPPRGIGAKAWETLTLMAGELGVPRWSVLQLVADPSSDVACQAAPTTRMRKALTGFHDLVCELLAARDTLPVSELAALLLKESGYAEWLRDGSEEGETRWENVEELAGVAADFDGLPPGEGLGLLLESVALVSDVDTMEDAPDRVTLLTLHAAKGLEFGHVFITGLEEGLLPHSKSFDDPESMAEERRLFYVGLTRAQERLFLVHCFRRRVFGADDVREPSRFIDDLPLDLTIRRGETIEQAPGHRAEVRWPTEPQAKPPTAPEFQAGDRVRHVQFGEGVVVASRHLDGDTEVTVAFPDVGIKKLLQSFAALVKT